MKEFIHGSDSQFRDLERRATAACVRFSGQEMPPGASPARATIGFENDPADCRALLLVERGIHYDGGIPEIQEWFRTGQKRFSSFQQLRHWIQNDLARSFEASASCEAPIAVADLTELNKVSVRSNANLESRIDEETLFSRLTVRIRGQDAALRLISKRVAQFLSKRRPQRPLSLVFCGPTGVGKTQTAEVLSGNLRELSPRSGFAFLRIDLSEFRESHRVSQMLGAPPGYVGHADGAPLVDKLSSNPRTIVLFDEFEKAHPDVLLVLMNAIDSGRLSAPSRKGRAREIDCRQAVFLFTSNLDCDGILSDLSDHAAFGEPEKADHICRSHFRAAGAPTELIGRMNAFIVFLPLTDSARAEIAVLSIRRAAGEYGVSLTKISPEAVSALLESTKADGFGARPYEHAADDLFGTAFAQAASDRLNGPVELGGQRPFQCVALKPSTSQSYGEPKH